MVMKKVANKGKSLIPFALVDGVREKFGWTKAKIYKHLDASSQAYNNWKKRGQIPLNYIDSFCELFKLKPNDILVVEEDMNDIYINKLVNYICAKYTNYSTPELFIPHPKEEEYYFRNDAHSDNPVQNENFLKELNDDLDEVVKIICEETGFDKSTVGDFIHRANIHHKEALIDHGYINGKFVSDKRNTLKAELEWFTKNPDPFKLLNVDTNSSRNEFIGHIDSWDSNTPIDEDEVEVPFFMDVELAAGSGSELKQENHGPKLRFSKSTLKMCRVQPEHAVCVKVSGNSMEPRLFDGDVVGVNLGDKKIVDGKIYAINHDGLLRIKQLHLIGGGGIRINSFNKEEHPNEVITNENRCLVSIIGRIFWSSSIWK